MARIIEKPPIYQGNTYERLDQLRDYLFRIADEINELERSIAGNGSGNGSGSSNGGSATVDQALNINSANAIANAAVTRALNGKANDNAIAAVGKTGSYNDLTDKPVIPPSAGVDTAMSDTSENAVQNKVIKAYVDGHIPASKTRLSRFTDDLGSSPTHTHNQYLTEHQSLAGYVLTTDSRLSDARTPLAHNHDDRYYEQDDIDEMIGAKMNEPNADGTQGQVLATDGSGGRYWKTVEGGGGGGGTDDYDELANKPMINSVELMGNKSAAQLGFATVATSGSYNDLSNKPVIPEAEPGTFKAVYGETTYAEITAALNAGKMVYVDKTVSSGFGQQFVLTRKNQSQGQPYYFTKTAEPSSSILLSFICVSVNQNNVWATESKSLATVAMSGSYNDLTDKPTTQEIFVATYSVTPFADIAAAINAGKYVFLQHWDTSNKMLIPISARKYDASGATTRYEFNNITTWNSSGTLRPSVRIYYVTPGNVWDELSYNL